MSNSSSAQQCPKEREFAFYLGVAYVGLTILGFIGSRLSLVDWDYIQGLIVKRRDDFAQRVADRAAKFGNHLTHQHVATPTAEAENWEIKFKQLKLKGICLELLPSPNLRT